MLFCIIFLSGHTNCHEVRKMESLWQKSVELPRFDTLDQDLKVDVLIIAAALLDCSVPTR